MTDLQLIRREADGMATLGELRLDPGPTFLCYTLENAWRNNERGVSCIPTGRYPLRLRKEGGYDQDYSGKRDSDGNIIRPGRFAWHDGMIEVVVLGRTFILVHIGNYHRNTDGCILVGDRKGTDFQGDGALTVWGSQDAYTRIYRQIHATAKAGGYLTVIDGADVLEAA